MKHPRDPWSWREARVDEAGDHFTLSFGSAADADWSQWPVVARIGRPDGLVFPVEFLAGATGVTAEMIAAAREEVQFFLVDKGERRPFDYARCHCGTASNLYSSIHWSFRERGGAGVVPPDSE